MWKDKTSSRVDRWWFISTAVVRVVGRLQFVSIVVGYLPVRSLSASGRVLYRSAKAEAVRDSARSVVFLHEGSSGRGQTPKLSPLQLT